MQILVPKHQNEFERIKKKKEVHNYLVSSVKVTKYFPEVVYYYFLMRCNYSQKCLFFLLKKIEVGETSKHG